MRVVPSATEPRKAKERSRPAAISRTIVNFLLDATLLVVFLTLSWITFVLRFIFPRGTSAAGWSLWGYSYDDWINFQFWTLALFMLGVLIHIMLHWTWVCGVISNRLKRQDGKPVRWEDGTRTLLGVGLIVLIVNILGTLMAVAALMIQSPK